MRNQAIVIPSALQTQIINIAHDSHQGISGTMALLKHKIYFYGMSSKIKSVVERCEACQSSTNQPIKPPVKCNPMPVKPWHHLAMDFYGPLAEDKKFVMVITCLYSRYVETAIISSVAGDSVIPILTKLFRRYGFPSIIRTDNGAPFSSHKFEQFMNEYNIKHQPTTPYWSRANGQVERLMQTLTKCRRIATITGIHYNEQIETTLASYRNTVHPSTNMTPTSLIFSHEVNTTRLPQIISESKTKRELIAEQCDAISKSKMENYANINIKERAHEFKVGDSVRVKIQIEQSKNKPTRELSPFKITALIGTQATIVNRHHTIPLLRNISQLIACNVSTKLDSEAKASKKRTVEDDSNMDNNNKQSTRNLRPRLAPK
jgi:hypothetical protein